VLYAGYSGTIHVFSNVENILKKITFRNELFVPDLLHNLFFVRKIEEKGMNVTFYNAKVLIQHDDNLVAIGERNNKMYQIKFNMYNCMESISFVDLKLKSMIECCIVLYTLITSYA